MMHARALRHIFSPKGILLPLLLFLTIFGSLFFLKKEESADVIITTKRLADLPPHGHSITGDSIMDPGHGVVMTSEMIIVPDDLWITQFAIKVNNAPDTSLHHAFLLQVKPTIYNAPAQGLPIPDPLYVAANDTIQHPITLPAPYGVFLSKGTPLQLYVMFHNPEPPLGPGGNYKNVSATLTLTAQPSNGADRSKKTEFRWLVLSDDPALGGEKKLPMLLGSFVFAVPEKTANFAKSGATEETWRNSGQYTFTASGTLVFIGGHLHGWQGGKKLDVFINNDLLESFVTARSSRKEWSWFTPQAYPLRRIAKGENISITATYENANEHPLRGAMGILGLYFSPDTPSSP